MVFNSTFQLMVKPMLKKLILLLNVTILFACASQDITSQSQPTYEHYRACDLMSLDFISTMQCGKSTRNSYCLPDNKCSRKGNSLVAYYDQLAMAVQTNELSEIEARNLFLKRNNAAEAEYNEVMKKINAQ